jgi:hypothetical protein
MLSVYVTAWVGNLINKNSQPYVYLAKFMQSSALVYIVELGLFGLFRRVICWLWEALATAKAPIGRPDDGLTANDLENGFGQSRCRRPDND